jgi:hypothetical protein
MSKFNKLVDKILNENVNMDKIISKVLKDMEFGDEQPQEVLDNCEIDYGVNGVVVAKELIERGLADEEMTEMLNDYIEYAE